MENKDYFTIQVIKQKDGFLKVNVMSYGVTWAKNIEDIGIAISELIQVVEQREKNFKKVMNDK
jgi:hypothetical protein